MVYFLLSWENLLTLLLTLGLFGRAQQPVPFSAPYMPPAAFFCVRLRVCVYESPKRLLNEGTQKDMKCTKNREKNSQKVTWPFSKNSVYNYQRNELKTYLYEPKNEWKLLCFAVFLAKMPSEMYQKRRKDF